MFKYIAFALLVATTLATFSINLEKKEIEDNQFVFYNSGTGQKQTVKTDAAPVNTKGDTVYTYSPKIEDDQKSVVFDTTVGENWEHVETKTPLINGKQTVDAAQGRATLNKAEASSFPKVNFNGNELKDVKVQRSNQVADTANKSIFKAANIGFALNRESNKNFMNTLKKNDVQLEKGGQGFSFIFSEQVNQLFFGEPQGFFAEGDLESIDAKSAENDKEWVIPVKKQGIALKGLDELSYKDPTYALFDTTTQYIWASEDLVNSIVAKLNSNDLNCLDINQTHPVGVYTCDKSTSYPALEFTFRTIDANDGENSKTYEVKNYTEDIGNDKVKLLIRQSGLYKESKSASDKVPSTTLGTKSNNLVILGTVFLENVYTYFSLDDHTVNMSQATKMETSDKDVSSTWRVWFLTLGTLGFIGAVVAILSLLKKVPYVPQVSIPKKVYSVPSVPQQQSYILQSQPVYQAQPQPIQQRFIQSGYQPQYQQPQQVQYRSSSPQQLRQN